MSPWIVFLFLLLDCVSKAAQITSSFTSPTWSSSSSLESAITTVTFSISAADGALGFDNTRVFEAFVRIVDDNMQVKNVTIRITYTDPMEIYDVFHIGWVFRNVYSFKTYACSNRLTNIEEWSNVFNATARAGTASELQGSLNDSFVSDDLGPLFRRLLSSQSEEGEALGADFDVSPELLQAVTLAASAASPRIANYLSQFDQVTKERLVPALATAAAYGDIITAALQSASDISNQSVQTFNVINQTAQFLLDSQQEILGRLNDINEVIAQGSTSINSTSANQIRQIQAMSDQVAAGALGSVNVTLLMNMMLEAIQSEFNDFFLSLSSSRGDIDNSHFAQSEAINEFTNLRLKPELRRTSVQQFWNLVDYLQPGGLFPFTSTVSPGQRPQGFVNEDAGDLLERAEYISFTIFWNSEIEDTSIDKDPDTVTTDNPLGVALDSLTGNALSARNSLKTSDESVGFRYANQRRVSFFCSKLFLLENRNALLTVQDLKRFIGPVGCSPGGNDTSLVPCQCWARVERYRCAVKDGVFVTSYSEPIPLLKDAVDICESPLDLDIWFDPRAEEDAPPSSDLSVTQKRRVEVFTSTIALDNEISSICTRTLGGASAGPTSDEKYFLAYTSFTGVDVQRPGVVFRILGEADRCSVNHAEMEIESNQQGSDITLPYMIYGFSRVATAQLFRTVYGDWETQAYGTIPEDHGSDIDPFFIQGLVDRLTPALNNTQPPPFARYCHILTYAFTGPEMVPVYEYVKRPGVFQDVTVEIIDPETLETITQRFSGDQGVRRTDSDVLSSLPLRYVHPGYDDCIYLNCGTPPRVRQEDNTVTEAFRPYLFDTHTRDISGQGQPELRQDKMDYIMDFTKGLGDFNPFINPRTRDMFTVDDWKRQMNRSVFDPRFVGRSIHEKVAFLIPEDRNATYQDPVTHEDKTVRLPGLRCHPLSIARQGGKLGHMCNILETHVLLPNGDILPELDATIGVRRFTQKFWGPSEFQTRFNGYEFVTVRSSELECPNPQQISVLFPGGTAMLNVDNQHSKDINVTVLSLNLDPSVNCTNKTMIGIIGNFSTRQFPLSYCPNQRIEVSVTTESGEIQPCWNNNVDMVKAAQAVNQTLYRGDLDLAGNTTSGISLQQTIIQKFTQQSDASAVSLALLNRFQVRAAINTLESVLKIRQISEQGALANDNREDTLALMADEAKLLAFKNQNLQEAAEATLAFQLQSNLNLTNSTDANQLALNRLAQNITQLNATYLRYIASRNITEFTITPEQQAQVDAVIALNVQLQTVNQNLRTIGNRTFSRTFLATKGINLLDLHFPTPFFTSSNAIASAYNKIAGVTGDVVALGVDQAKKALQIMKLNPKCPGGFQVGCTLKNLFSGIMHIIMVVAIIGAILVITFVVLKAANMAKSLTSKGGSSGQRRTTRRASGAGSEDDDESGSKRTYRDYMAVSQRDDDDDNELIHSHRLQKSNRRARRGSR